MLSNIYIPKAISNLPNITDGKVAFVLYKQYATGLRNRVVFNENAISFIRNGEKQLCTPGGNAIIHTGEAVVIPEGNSIIAERSLNESCYTSLVVTFPSESLAAFFRKWPVKQPNNHTAAMPVMQVSNYLEQFIANVIHLIENGTHVSPTLVSHKFDELLLVLTEECPATILFLYKLVAASNATSLKNIVENNLHQNISIEELAFLSNRSLSTFKRDFEKNYGMPPAKYIREKRLEIAATELLKGRHASELYMDYGYENLSSFVQAYKRKFGITPGKATA